MKSSRDFATALVDRYESITHSNFGSSELKLQKLMYFLQRQSLALTGEPLFEEQFIGWVHGPVLESLRFILEEPSKTSVEKELNDKEKFLVDSVICEYGKYSAWELREKTHHEISWLKSREGLGNSDYGHEKLNLEDIRKDAEKVRIYDPLYDMYIDEFEDADFGVAYV